MNRPPSLQLVRAATLGALMGALSLAALELLQSGAASMAGMSWTREAPLLNLWLYPLVGALLGGIAAPLLEALRRAVAPRVHGLAWAGGWLALGAYAGRAGVTAALRAHQGLPGGRLAALAAQLAISLGLGAAAVWILHRREARRAAQREARRAAPCLRAPLRDALCLSLPTLAAVYLTHLRWLAIKREAELAGLLGAPTLALTAAAGVVGVGLGACLLGPAEGRGGRPRLLPALTAAALVLGMSLALVSQRPPDRGGRGAAAPAAAEPAPPNVLLIVLDTLRRDAVSAYGAVAGTTPRLDAFAAQGVRWDDCLANGPWTVPSHASLFTGAEVSRHGAGHARERLRRTPGGPGTAPLPTAAELLARRGYGTAAYVCNMNVSRANGFDRGFGDYQEIWRAGQGDYDVLAPALRAWGGLGVFDKGGELCTRGVNAWLDERAGDERPWFLFVNLMEAHSPYLQAPERFARAFLQPHEPTLPVRALIADTMAHVHRAGVDTDDAEQLWRVYLGGVLYQDWLLGRVLDRLDALGLEDDTLVIVTSDHGENFGWNQLLGHGQDLNDDLLRVPLVMRGPGLPRGVVQPTPASLVDILPTLLALTGQPPLPPDPGRDGLALAGAGAPDPTLLAERPRVVEKYPLFLHDLAESDARTARVSGRPGEARWAWGRRGIYRGAHKLVELDGPSGAEAGHATGASGAADASGAAGRAGPAQESVPPRLTRASGQTPAPPADDGRRPLEAPDVQTELASLLQRLRASWPAALDPTQDQLSAPDDEDLERLRALGYVGGSGER